MSMSLPQPCHGGVQPRHQSCPCPHLLHGPWTCVIALSPALSLVLCQKMIFLRFSLSKQSNMCFAFLQTVLKYFVFPKGKPSKYFPCL